jgi:uncharacterized membrane protein
LTRDSARRFAAYALIGYAGEAIYTAAADVLLRRARPPRLRPSGWMLPVYGLAQPLYEPARARLRRRPAAVRAIAYGLGFSAVEYASGRALRATLGAAPWDYSHARYNLHGLARADYLPLWAAVGLGLERVADRLGG